jgi:uncharacterized protein (TIGR03435 family)
MKLHIVAGLSVAFAGVTAIAQTPAPLPAFEVAAVRPAALPTPETFRSGQFRIGTTVDKGRVDFEFVSLADLLPYAFGVKSFQVSGPEWMKASRWNIQATLPEGAPQAQVPAMMQQLLADRFQLTIHHEKREQPVYELVVAKGGPKLEAAEAVSGAPAADSAPNVGLPGLFGGLGAGPPGPPPGAPPGGPGQGQGNGRAGPTGEGRGGAVFAGANGTTRITPNGNCGMHLELASVTMASLSDTLAPFLDRPVLDETELKGPYKVVLDLPIEVLFGMFRNAIQGAGFGAPGQGGGFAGPGRGDDGGGGRGGGGGPFAGCGDALGAGGDPSSNAALFQAVQKLGLKLQQKKALFDTIIVDHLEKAPTEN